MCSIYVHYIWWDESSNRFCEILRNIDEIPYGSHWLQWFLELHLLQKTAMLVTSGEREMKASMMTRGLFVFVLIVIFFLFIFFTLLGIETVKKTANKVFGMYEPTSSQVMYVCLFSGGSRISPRWVRQPGGGVGKQRTLLPKFPKNCMKLKEFGSRRGRTSKILLCKYTTAFVESFYSFWKWRDFYGIRWIWYIWQNHPCVNRIQLQPHTRTGNILG